MAEESIEFNVGDIVVLKSGGPKMTVEDMIDDGRLQCVWTVREVVQDTEQGTELVANDTLKRDYFRKEVLQASQ